MAIRGAQGVSQPPNRRMFDVLNLTMTSLRREFAQLIGAMADIQAQLKRLQEDRIA